MRINDKIILITSSIIFIIMISIISLSLPTNHDEYQYIAAAYLSQDQYLYTDFFYSQTPYFPVSLGYVYSIFATDGSGIFVVSRLFNLFWSVLFATSLLIIIFQITRKALVSVTICALVMMSELIEFSLRTARNDMMPLALVTIALLLTKCAITERTSNRQFGTHLAVGALLSAAVCTKQSFIFVILPFAIHALLPFKRRLFDQLRLAALPMAIGAFLAAVPALWMALQNLDNFIYSNGEFHQTMHAVAFYGTAEPGFYQKLTQMKNVLSDPSLILLSFLVPFFIIANHPRSPKEILNHELAPLLLLTLMVCICISASLLLADPLWPQYAAPILPFLASFLAIIVRMSNLSFGVIAKIAPLRLTLLIAITVPAVLLSSFALSNHGVLPHLWGMLQNSDVFRAEAHPQEGGAKIWITEHTRGARHDIQRALGKPDKTLKIATLLSPYPLEAGFGIYNELAGSPFFYWVNDTLPVEKRARLRGVSPDTVASWLHKIDAKAVLVGYNKTEIESGFVEYATSNEFLCYNVDLDGSGETRNARLYVRPDVGRGKPDCESGRTT